MKGRSWGLACVVVMGCAVAGLGGCAPTGIEEEDELVAESRDALVQCGDGACETGETCASCPGDCGRCTSTHCGDGTCGRKESCATCARDCGACPGCGNGVCDAAETCTSCSKDCGRCGGEFCGNGVCGRRESCTACSRDCCPVVTPECLTAADCPAPGSECVIATCESGTCGTVFAAAGTPTLSQVGGDCQETVCDGAGGTTQEGDEADLPIDDGNECTADVCTPGNPPLPEYVPAAEGTSCTGGTCDGTGTCVPAECQSVNDCPPATHGCETAMCVLGTCSVLLSPMNAPSSDQVANDCQVVLCDGMGGWTSQPDDTDQPLDTDCMYGTCVMGQPSYTPEPLGTPCDAPFPALGICNGEGSCM